MHIMPARGQGAKVLEGHDSQTFHTEALGLLADSAMETEMGVARASPALAVAIDERGR